MIELDRKVETRKKIQLGGLIVKAGLENETTALLYGLLLEAKELLMEDKKSDTRLKWQLKGEVAFKEKS